LSDDIAAGGDAAAWARGDFTGHFPGAPMRYRSQWYVLDGAAPLLFGLGVHGQNLFVDRQAGLVIAKLSSQPVALDTGAITVTLRAVAALRNALAGATAGRS